MSATRGRGWHIHGFLTGLVILSGAAARAQTPGLPFTEDFSTQDLMDATRTTANWSTGAQTLTLAPRVARFDSFGSTAVGANVGAQTDNTWSLALGDVDGDGDLDIVAGNNGQQNRLYLNNGTPNPFNGVAGVEIDSADTHSTCGIALGDVDGDGDLDLVAGNYAGINRLYLNNGTTDPFNLETISEPPSAGCRFLPIAWVETPTKGAAHASQEAGRRGHS